MENYGAYLMAIANEIDCTALYNIGEMLWWIGKYEETYK